VGARLAGSKTEAVVHENGVALTRELVCPRPTRVVLFLMLDDHWVARPGVDDLALAKPLDRAVAVQAKHSGEALPGAVCGSNQHG
jgi:hypothetical protein